MILVCTACNARYLVPATAFAKGPRLVRCARCSYTWQASLSSEARATVAVPVSSAFASDKVSSISTSNSLPPEVKIEAPLASPRSVEEAPLTETPETMADIPAGSGLPAIWKPSRWQGYAQKIAAVFMASVFVWLLVWGIAAREGVMRQWPSLKPVYAIVGLLPPKVGEGLSLQNVRSERRFEDGSMQLLVAGDIRNDSSDIMVLPTIQALVLGADGQILYRWQIVPSVPKLDPAESLPFVSAVRSPSGSVSEINLSFVENKEHAE